METEGGRRTTLGALIARDSAAASLAAVVTRTAPLASLVVIASAYGTSPSIDAFFLSLTIPLFAAGVLGMAISTVFVPVLARQTHRPRADYAAFAGELVVVTAAAASLAAGLVAVTLRFLPHLLPALRSPDASVSALLALLVPLITVRGAYTALCHVQKRFVLPSVCAAIAPLVVATGVYVFSSRYGTTALVASTILGHAIELALLIAAMRFSGAPMPTLQLGMSTETRSALVVATPQVFSGALLKLNPIVDRAMAALLGAGGVSALVFAERLQSAPQQLLALGFFNVLLAHWSLSRASAPTEELLRNLFSIQRVLVSVLIPLTGFLVVFRSNIVTVALSRGALDINDVARIGTVFGVYVLQIFPMISMLVLTRVLLVYQDTKFLMKAGMANAAMNAAGNVLFVYGLRLGLAGIALSTVVTTWILWGVFVRAVANRSGASPALGVSGSQWLRSAVATGGGVYLAGFCTAAAQDRYGLSESGWESLGIAASVVLGVWLIFAFRELRRGWSVPRPSPGAGATSHPHHGATSGRSFRVLIVIKRFHPATCFGGAEAFAARFADTLARRHNRVTVLSARRRPHWPRHEQSGASNAPVDIRRLPYPRIRILGTFVWCTGLLATLVASRGRYDVVFVTFASVEGAVARVSRWFTGVPVVCKLAASGGHGDIGEWSGRWHGRWTKGLLRGIDRFVALNPEARENLAAIGVPGARVDSIPNGVDTDAFHPAGPTGRTRALRDLGFEPGTRLILAVGRYAQQKGFDVLIRALAELDDPAVPWRAVLLGRGPMRQHLAELAATERVAPRVRMTASTNVIPYLHACSVFVLPSRWEGLSNALLEAQACGVPCVCTDIPGNREVVTTGVNGLLVPADDPIALSRAIRRVLTDPGLSARLMRGARERARSAYSLEAVTRRYEECFEFAAIRRRPRDHESERTEQPCA